MLRPTGGQMMATEHVHDFDCCTLPGAVRDRLARIELLRANAAGARRMAESFDAEADALNRHSDA